MQRLKQKLRRFSFREDGTLLVEAVLVLPMLLWAVFAMFVFWDSYKSINTVQKASYTVSDTISRIQDDIDGTYITGLRNVMNFLLDHQQTTKMRVTSVTWDQVEDRFEVLWSYSPGGAEPALTTPTLQPYANRIPAMADGDTVVVVETAVDYKPAFNVGVNDMTIRQFIVTRPRMGRVCFSGVACF